MKFKDPEGKMTKELKTNQFVDAPSNFVFTLKQD